MFSERTYFDGTPTSKIWLCGKPVQKNWKGNFKVFTLNVQSLDES